MKLYLDSSALAKLVQREPESTALRPFLHRHRDDRRVTTASARVELVRAVSAGGPDAVSHARRQQSRVDQVTLDGDLLDAAATLAPGLVLGSLDAIHLASAQVLGSDLPAVSTYDQPVRAAGIALGIAVNAPA